MCDIQKYSLISRADETLRPYQQQAKEEIFKKWDEVDSVMFQMPTGTGKTRLFTSIINDIKKYGVEHHKVIPILIVAHRVELIEQISKSLGDYKISTNIIASGKKKVLPFVNVYVASIQTLTHYQNSTFAKNIKAQFVIIDEAHHALATTYKKLWAMYPEAKMLGVTATPWRMNHQSFTDLFDKLVLSMPVKEFINQGYLAPYKYYSLKSDSVIHKTIDDIELDRFGEYRESSMEEKMDIGSIRAQLLNSYQALAKGKKGIIYAINITHAKHICEEYELAGYNVVSIDSKTPAEVRKKMVDKFKNGGIDIIVNVDIFSEGFDCPDIEFIQLARPTRSLVKYLQQVGRGLRTNKTGSKEDCIILDNVGVYQQFGLPDAKRHWLQHFLGKNVIVRPQLSNPKENGSSRIVDMSEGTEDMELIQDVSDDVEFFEDMLQDRQSTLMDALFPLEGITLGKTTWKQAMDMGCVIEKKYDIFIRTSINGISFSDDEKKGVFMSASLYRFDYATFPSSWESIGFKGSNSYKEWLSVFKNIGCNINILKRPTTGVFCGEKHFRANFEATTPDNLLRFTLNFDYGHDGHKTDSANTLSSLSVNYQGEISIDKEEAISDKDINRLKQLFDRKNTSYKYFWLLSILQLFAENKVPRIRFENIVARMLSNASVYLIEEKGVFSKTDQLPKYVETLYKRFPHKKEEGESIKSEEILKLLEGYDFCYMVSSLVSNLPYRFLSPWIPFTTNYEVAEYSNKYDARCLYAIEDSSIFINPIWREYLSKNNEQLIQYVEEELHKYLKIA